MALFLWVKFFAASTFVAGFLIDPTSASGSQIILAESRLLAINGEELAACGEDQFECRNRDCIPGELLCDGKADCKDHSDETRAECSKPGRSCPTGTFRCDYGACVAEDAMCNGVTDCLDNSDELLPQCPRPEPHDHSHFFSLLDDEGRNCSSKDRRITTFRRRIFRSKTSGQEITLPSLPGRLNWPWKFTTPKPLASSTSTPTPELRSSVCVVPPQPLNGRWKLHPRFCTGDESCDIPQGIALQLGSQLVYSCAEDFVLRGNSDVYCEAGRSWSSIPTCESITCTPLNSVSRAASYSRFGDRVNSTSSILPYTTAKITCRRNYGLEGTFSTGSEQDVECSPSGNWEPQPITCSPVCGVVNTSGRNGVATNETSTEADPFPWHANLWTEIQTPRGFELTFLCSATIIEPNFVVTAAHCVTDGQTRVTKDPSLLRVSGGRNDDNESNTAQNSPSILHKVKNVYRYCKDFGRVNGFSSDIALVELMDPFEFTTEILPACLDVSSLSELTFQPGTVGRIDGFWRGSSNMSNPVPPTLEVTYVPNSECRVPFNYYQGSNTIKNDEFCGVYSDETAVCDSDTGRGFVAKKSGLWHLMGILTRGLGSNQDGTQRSCGENPYSLYTKVSFYVAWIEDVMFQLQRYKSYPQCSFDLAPPAISLPPPGSWSAGSTPIGTGNPEQSGTSSNAGSTPLNTPNFRNSGIGLNAGSTPTETLNSANSGWPPKGTQNPANPFWTPIGTKESISPSPTLQGTQRLPNTGSTLIGTQNPPNAGFVPTENQNPPNAGSTPKGTQNPANTFWTPIGTQQPISPSPTLQGNQRLPNTGSTLIGTQNPPNAGFVPTENQNPPNAGSTPKETQNPANAGLTPLGTQNLPNGGSTTIENTNSPNTGLTLTGTQNSANADSTPSGTQNPPNGDPTLIGTQNPAIAGLTPLETPNLPNAGSTTIGTQNSPNPGLTPTGAQNPANADLTPTGSRNPANAGLKPIGMQNLPNSGSPQIGSQNPANAGSTLVKTQDPADAGLTKPDTPDPAKTGTPLSIDSTQKETTNPVTSVTPPSVEFSCLVPSQPANGAWKLHQDSCNNTNCNLPQGVVMGLGNQLVYTCNPGFRIKGNPNVFCSNKGRWSAIPECVEIRCNSLESVSRMVTCYRFNNWIPCSSSALPNTRAVISCRVGYREDTSSLKTNDKTVECNQNGEWEPRPITCLPVCGVTNSRQAPTVIDGTAADVTEFPWHATLYKQRNATQGVKEFICGATIIQDNLVLTAAHCVYDDVYKAVETPEKFSVAAGNRFRDYDSPLHDARIVQKSTVKRVYVPCQYFGLLGLHASDIALIELREPFQLSSILTPACLDLPGNSDQILEVGSVGKIAGFGRTATGKSSAILLTTKIPYVSYSQCRMSQNDDGNVALIVQDKFCGGNSRGMAVCNGDSGGGLTFDTGGVWNVMGILSVSLGVDTSTGEASCDRKAYSLYTKVSHHMAWIRSVMNHLENNKTYPLCDRR